MAQFSGGGFPGLVTNVSNAFSQSCQVLRLDISPPLNNFGRDLDFYIDDMIFPLYSQNSVTTYGFNVIEINAGTSTTLGYFDDVRFALEIPPNPTATQSGSR